LVTSQMGVSPGLLLLKDFNISGFSLGLLTFFISLLYYSCGYL